AGAHHHRVGQRVLQLPHHEPAAAARGFPRGPEGGVRQAARQQPAHPGHRGGPERRGDHARHHRGQPGLREGRVSQAGLPWRHHLLGDRGRREAGVALAAPVGHRDLRAPGAQPARRRGDDLPARRHDAAAGRLRARILRMRRSLHFVPGGNEKMIAKALTLPADGLILDLEDAVTPALKPATRPIVRRWLETLDFGGRERWIRMNPVFTDYAEADLAETIAGRPDGYVVPKPRRAEDVRRVAALLDAQEQAKGVPFGSTRLVLIATETPEGLLNIQEIAGASPR